MDDVKADLSGAVPVLVIDGERLALDVNSDLSVGRFVRRVGALGFDTAFFDRYDIGDAERLVTDVAAVLTEARALATTRPA